MSRRLQWVTGSGTYADRSAWIDVTGSPSAAAAGPGLTDAVVIAGPTGGAIQTIAGPGSAGSVSITGNTALDGSYLFGALSVGAGTAATLDLDVGATLTVASASLVSGGVLVDAGAMLAVSGTMAVGLALSVRNGGTAEAAALVLAGGTLTLDAASAIEIGRGGGAAPGEVTVDAGATLTSRGGYIDGTLTDAGTLDAVSGATGVFGDITGAGVLQIEAGAMLFAAGAIGSGTTVVFVAAAGTLMLYTAADRVRAVISGFTFGDVIDVSGAVLSGASYAATGAGTGTLVLSVNDQPAMSLALSGDFAGSTFLIAPDGIDGTRVMLASGGGGGGGTLSPGTTASDKYRWATPAGGAWASAANWVDVSAGQTPAAIAPGAKNVVTIDGPTGATAQVISGRGNAQSLTFTGNTVLSGTISTGTVIVGSHGTLAIAAGGTLTLGSGSVGANGGWQVSGTGASAVAGGALTLGAGVVASVLDHGGLRVAKLALNGGTVAVDGTSTLEIGKGGQPVAGTLMVDAATTLASTGGVVNAVVVDNGTIAASRGLTAVFGAVSGTGLMQIGAGATLFLGDAVGAGVTAGFLASTGTLFFTAAGWFGGTVTGFASGDALDVSGAVLTSAVYTATGSGIGTLVLSAGGVTPLTITLAGTAYSGGSFQTMPDKVDGTLVTFTPGSAGTGGTLSPGTPGPDAYAWSGARTGGDWGTAANWTDQTSGAQPAAVAPGHNNLVTIAAPGGASVAVITGQGAAATLSLTGNAALQGTFAVGTLTVGHGKTAGVLTVGTGTALSAGTAALTAGGLQVSGTGALLTVGGTLTVGVATRLSALGRGDVQAVVLALNGGTLAVDGTSVIEVGAGGLAGGGAVTVDDAATLTSSGGVINGPLVDNGALIAAGGTTVVFGDISGAGRVAIGAGATLFAAGAVGFGNTVAFGGGGTLLLYAGNAFGGTMTGFAPGDVIDVSGVVLTGVAFTKADATSGTLTLSVNGVTVLSLFMAGADYSAAAFRLAPDGVDGTVISLPLVPCYAAGTRIRTPRGDAAVEDLRIGDCVVTRFNGAQPVTWMGRRRIDMTAHPRPERVRPVRVRRDAFGDDRPLRDLLLSPEHAVLVDGVLMPIHLLVNGATVLRDDAVPVVTYVHVELEQHDVLFAEGLAAESFLDTGNRATFAGEAGSPPDAAHALAVWAARGCAELVLSGPHLAAARRTLRMRAEALGWRLGDDPGLCVWAGATRIESMTEGPRLVFALPEGVRTLRLASRTAVPAELDAASGDRRRLGVAVQCIVVDGRVLALDDAALSGGWHDAEPGWRWTDGDAEIFCPLARRLDVVLLPLLRYWVCTVAIRPARLAAR